MKKENNSFSLVSPIIVLVLIGSIVTGALALTNQITAPVIAEQQAKAAEAAKQVVLPDGVDFTAVTGVEGLPAEVISVDEAGNGAGYVITTETKGFGGVIQAMFGIDADGAITGSKVLVQAETEGIGSKVVSDGSSFQAQLVGMTDPSNIQAISGATVSSTGMTNAVKAVFNAYTVLNGGTIEAVVYAPPSNMTDEALAEYYSGVSFTDVVGGKTSDQGTVVYAGAQGLQSEVKVAVCFDQNDKIIGLIVDASGETPGIGDKAAEKAYTDQFIGVESGDAVDIISGSTFSTAAVKDAVNIAIANLETVKAAPETDAPVLAPVETIAPVEAPDADALLEELYPGVSFTDVPNGKTSDQGTVVYASAQGFASQIKVTVCFDGNDKIIGVSADASGETPGIGTKAGEKEFTDKFVGVKSADEVDAIAGATVASAAVKDAVNSAIENLAAVKAGEGLPEAPAESEEPVATIAPAEDDVTITTSAKGFAGQVSITVTFGSDGVIKSLSAKAPTETQGIGSRAVESSYTNKFIGAKNGNAVDTLSGATLTSTAIKNAVNHAVKAFQAGKSGNVPPAPEATPEPVEPPAPAEDDVTIVATAQGLLSQITANVTFGADGAIKGLSVDASGETPGIGSKAAESSYTGKFIGSKNGNSVDAVAGATVTSTAVKNAVNAAADAFKSGKTGPVSAAGSAATPAPAETPAPVEETPAPVEAPAEEPAAGPKTITASAQGLLSTVNVTVTFDANGVITALSVDASGETAGIGSQAAESGYTGKFIGATNGDGVDTIAGATVTSTAVKSAVNSAAAQFKSN